MSVARIIALSGIGVAIFFLAIITIQYFLNSKKNNGVVENEGREGTEDSTHDD